MSGLGSLTHAFKWRIQGAPKREGEAYLAGEKEGVPDLFMIMFWLLKKRKEKKVHFFCNAMIWILWFVLSFPGSFLALSDFVLRFMYI